VTARAADTPAPSDAAIVARAATGDRDALGALYDRHAATLLAVAFRLLMSTPDAEDVVHDVFVGLPEALRRYEERGTLVSWLKRITVRVALSRIRRQESQSSHLVDASTRAPTRDYDTAIALDAAVAQLPPSMRAVLVLKEIEGYSHAEIAEMVGISVAASKVRLHRALHVLRIMLEDR
jgi:RNA polymerase sigma-70 factor (ECF subfamily)